MRKILLSLMMISLMVPLWGAESAPYGGRTPEICFKEFTSSERKRREIEVILASYDSLLKPYDHKDSLWDPQFLKDHPEYANALRDYRKGKRGQKARQVKLEGLSPEEIHQLLLKEGFIHHREPLRQSFKKSKAWEDDQTLDSKDKQPHGVMMDVYTHKDGSRIRVKPSSIPDYERRTPLRFPHYSLSVMLDLKHLEGGYDQEAFKLTKQGHPVPRAPTPNVGFRFIFKDDEKFKRRLQADVAMGAVHFLLPSTCGFGLMKESK